MLDPSLWGPLSHRSNVKGNAAWWPTTPVCAMFICPYSVSTQVVLGEVLCDAAHPTSGSHFCTAPLRPWAGGMFGLMSLMEDTEPVA